MNKIVLILSIIPLLLIIPTSYAQVEFCGTGYYIMHDKCYELPPFTPQLNTDLRMYEPILTNQIGDKIHNIVENERTYITTTVKNDGDIIYDVTVSVTFLKAEIGEWSKTKFMKTIINPGKQVTVAIPFLLAQDINDIEVKVQLINEEKIVAQYKEPLEITSSVLEELTDSEIPAWVKGIFAYYAEGKLTDQELIDAIKFLINSNVIVL